jgi:hypothetical protein
LRGRQQLHPRHRRACSVRILAVAHICAITSAVTHHGATGVDELTFNPTAHPSLASCWRVGAPFHLHSTTNAVSVSSPPTRRSRMRTSRAARAAAKTKPAPAGCAPCSCGVKLSYARTGSSSVCHSLSHSLSWGFSSALTRSSKQTTFKPQTMLSTVTLCPVARPRCGKLGSGAKLSIYYSVTQAFSIEPPPGSE